MGYQFEKLWACRKVPLHDSARRQRGKSLAEGGVAHHVPIVTEVWQRRLEGHVDVSCHGGTVVFKMNAHDEGVTRVEAKVDPNVGPSTIPADALL